VSIKKRDRKEKEEDKKIQKSFLKRDTRGGEYREKTKTYFLFL